MFALQKTEIAKYGPQKGNTVQIFMYKDQDANKASILTGFPMLASTTLFKDARLFKTKKEAIRAKKTSSYWKDYQVVDFS